MNNEMDKIVNAILYVASLTMGYPKMNDEILEEIVCNGLMLRRSPVVLVVSTMIDEDYLIVRSSCFLDGVKLLPTKNYDPTKLSAAEIILLKDAIAQSKVNIL